MELLTRKTTLRMNWIEVKPNTKRLCKRKKRILLNTSKDRGKLEKLIGHAFPIYHCSIEIPCVFDSQKYEKKRSQTTKNYY